MKNELDIIHKLEKKFDFLENIYFKRVLDNGDYLFSCLDLGEEAVLVVDTEGWVFTRLLNKKFYDSLGHIH